MNILSKLTMAFATVAVAGSLAFAPAFAQGDAFGSTQTTDQASLGATGEQMQTNYTTGSQARQVGNGVSPLLQGATNGTISPQGGEATVVQVSTLPVQSVSTTWPTWRPCSTSSPTVWKSSALPGAALP